ncbi:vacuolar protein sorting-associated protein 41 [Anaeramoeba flamelloides]|uniref:Vacuolar protein sorting-associated protein 41 n=1 Tax=Anaeramoeba flamelloides TaxID=1746091 RepID=A0AAV7YZM8_9EUKA|nr:vacuolar protein sorting-associated protein 41 [Anaeramoeba flamelloides]
MSLPLQDPKQENTQETKQMNEPKQQFTNELPINNQQQNLQQPLFYPTNMFFFQPNQQINSTEQQSNLQKKFQELQALQSQYLQMQQQIYQEQMMLNNQQQTNNNQSNQQQIQNQQQQQQQQQFSQNTNFLNHTLKQPQQLQQQQTQFTNNPLNSQPLSTEQQQIFQQQLFQQQQQQQKLFQQQQQQQQQQINNPQNETKKETNLDNQTEKNNKEEKKEQNNQEENKSENGDNKESEKQKEKLSTNSFKITKITNQNLYEDSDESEISCSSDNEDGNLNIPIKNFRNEEEKVLKKRQVDSFEIKEKPSQIEKEGNSNIKNENKELKEKEILHNEEKNQTKLITNNTIFFNPNYTNNKTTNNQKPEKDQKSKNSSEYNSFSNFEKNTNINTNETPNITNKINNSQNETVLKDKINSNSESNLSISSDSESLSLSISELDSEPEYIPKVKNENPQSTFFEKTNIAKGFADLPDLMNKKVIEETQTQTQTQTQIGTFANIGTNNAEISKTTNSQNQSKIETFTSNSTNNAKISKTINDPKQSKVINGEQLQEKITINIESSELKKLNVATDDESEISEGDMKDTSSDDYYINSEKRSTASSEITSIKKQKNIEKSVPIHIFDPLVGDIQNILNDENTSCFVTTPTYLIIGTTQGSVLICNYFGKILSQRILYQLPVNNISVNAAGDYIVACSNDGVITVLGLKNNKKNIFEYHQAIRCITINPRYPKKKKIFAAGLKNGKIIMRSKKRIRKKDRILSEDEGQIYSITWNGKHIIWASSRGITMYKFSKSQSKKSQTIQIKVEFAQSSLFHSIFHWISKKRFLIGWSTFLKVFEINSKKSIELIKTINFNSIIIGISEFQDKILLLSGQDEKKEIVITKSHIKKINLKLNKSKGKGKGKNKRDIEDLVENGGIIIDNITTKEREQYQKFQPKIIGLTKDTFNVAFEETVEFEDYDEYFYYDFRLDCYGKNIFVASPKTILIGRVREMSDKLDWLLHKKRFLDAYNLAKGNKNRIELLELQKISGQLLIDYFNKGQWKRAISQCEEICGNDEFLWMHLLDELMGNRKLIYIFKKIPTKAPQLPNGYYEKILLYCIKESMWDEFSRSIKTWSLNIFSHEKIIPRLKKYIQQSVHPLITRLIFQLDDFSQNINKNNNNNNNSNRDNRNNNNNRDNNNIENNDENSKKDIIYSEIIKKMKKEGKKSLQCLYEFYYRIKNYYPSLAILIFFKLGDPFEEILKKKLWKKLKFLIVPLVEFDPKKSINFFLQNLDNIPIETVVDELKNAGKSKQNPLYKYLDQIFEKSEFLAPQYHLILFQLYGQFERSKIYELLDQSPALPLEKALEICLHDKLDKEAVRILDMMGNASQSLSFQLQKIGNVKNAINYVKSKNDPTLWEELINHCLNNNAFFAVLLEEFPKTNLDFLEILEKIPSNMKIENLKTKIRKIIIDRQLQVELMNVTKLILKDTFSDLYLQFNSNQSLAVRIEENQFCSICKKPISQYDLDYRAFFCGHSYHEDCLSKKMLKLHKSLLKKQKKNNTKSQKISDFCIVCKRKK